MIRFALLVSVATFAINPLAVAQTVAPPAQHRTDTPHPASALPKPGDRDCLRSTGSLIPAKPGHCLPVAGRTYSQKDLRRTGALTTADALRMLDPGIH